MDQVKLGQMQYSIDVSTGRMLDFYNNVNKKQIMDEALANNS
jgi:hypothetical protein